jgi:HAMP domain-containing protein
MRSIRSLIFIRLFSVILIFFVVVSGFAYLLTAETMREFVVSDAATSLSFIISNIEANYKTDLAALDEVAAMPSFIPFDEKGAQRSVREFLDLPNLFSTVHMYKTDGELVFAELREEPTNGPYAPKKNFHQKDPQFVSLVESVIREKQPHSSPTFFTKSGSLYQTYVTPVFDDATKQHVIGVLSGGVFPRWKKIDYLLKGLKLGRENFILITDDKGNLISSDGITDAMAAQVANAHTQQLFMNKKIHLGSSSFIAMSKQIPDQKMIVTLGVNMHPLDEKIKEMSYRLLAALVVGLVLCLIASAYIGEQLARPFREMAETINEINIGNFAVRTKYNRNDEIGYLSERINRLAEKIQKSEYLGNLWSNEVELEEQRGLGPERSTKT